MPPLLQWLLQREPEAEPLAAPVPHPLPISGSLFIGGPLINPPHDALSLEEIKKKSAELEHYLHLAKQYHEPIDLETVEAHGLLQANLEEPMSTAPVVPAVHVSKLQAFEGFLKKAGHIAGVVLTDVVKYAIPVAGLIGIADPAAAPAISVFETAVKLVQNTVVMIQQKWAASGPEANTQRLADVLSIVEQPIISEFASVGIQVDTAYVTNLVTGVVAILNAQPGSILPAKA